MKHEESNINQGSYLMNEKIIEWTAENRILDEKERVIATDYTGSKDVERYQAQWHQVSSNLGIGSLILLTALIASSIFKITFLIVLCSIFLFYMLRGFAYLYSLKTEPKVIVFTSRRII